MIQKNNPVVTNGLDFVPLQIVPSICGMLVVYENLEPL